MSIVILESIGSTTVSSRRRRSSRLPTAVYRPSLKNNDAGYPTVDLVVRRVGWQIVSAAYAIAKPDERVPNPNLTGDVIVVSREFGGGNRSDLYDFKKAEDYQWKVERGDVILADPVGDEPVTTYLPAANSGVNSTFHESEEGRLERELESYLQRLAIESSEVIFEDGMESSFGAALSSAILSYGPVAMTAIAKTFNLSNPETDLVGEMLRIIGTIKHEDTHRSRLMILISALRSPDPRIRDDASIGLAGLGDPKAIDSLKIAVEREPVLQLRKNFALVIDQLTSTKCRNI